MRVIIYTWRKANGNGSQQPQPLQLSFDLNQTLEQGSKGSRGKGASELAGEWLWVGGKSLLRLRLADWAAESGSKLSCLAVI